MGVKGRRDSKKRKLGKDWVCEMITQFDKLEFGGGGEEGEREYSNGATHGSC